jgi:uncharacterized protein (DUF1778 family)
MSGYLPYILTRIVQNDRKATSTMKTSRLETRVTAEQKALIERAAAYQGRTVSDFVVHTVHEAARSVIQENELLQLDQAQSRAFVELLLNPRKPNKAVKQALGDYRKHVTSQ